MGYSEELLVESKLKFASNLLKSGRQLNLDSGLVKKRINMQSEICVFGVGENLMQSQTKVIQYINGNIRLVNVDGCIIP